MSAFIDFAAVESGDEDNVEQFDEEPATAAGYDYNDGFVVDDEEDTVDVAKGHATGRRADKYFEKNLDQAELEEESRQLALDHGLVIPQQRKRLKKRKEASYFATDDELEKYRYQDSCVEEEQKGAEQECMRKELKRQRQRREAERKRRELQAMFTPDDVLSTVLEKYQDRGVEEKEGAEQEEMRLELKRKRQRQWREAERKRREVGANKSSCIPAESSRISDKQAAVRKAIAAAGKIPKKRGAHTVNMFG